MKAGTSVLTVKIEINPRVHIGLISMHAGAPRKNGGLGFAVEGPTASIKTTSAPDLGVFDRRPKPMREREIERLRDQLEQIKQQLDLPSAATFEIAGGFLTHCGMGSGTAIKLACIEGLLEINHRTTGRKELIRLSGRGGTSGVGISTYFDGGFAFDLGVVGGKSDHFVPSSIGAADTLPLQLHRQSLPDWPLGLCLPRKCEPKTQEEEIEFFRRATPLPSVKSYEAAYVAVFQVLASLMEQDYRSFCQAISAIQESEWKRLERAEYAPHVDHTDKALRELGVDCVGMSSLGPLLYFFASSETLERVRAHSEQLDADIFLTVPNNSGRRMTSI
ncbi:beta-ribofuranosylaminobenzene 5'-phosphate synthase family protein [Rhizobium bangladeshense]|uniref:beta-ribofuranosylaminobenzene 5'-phosphate synthase family protein n=1 Tax=Rhizobium bangladeshense TaxID=1138189 RepID=UPI001A98B388|nr:beta-ribofuranosylaminobenzene 5'-phosphate synthase family protein [Rhizobium bangladeshense]MBX4894598.1 hypothetical protein [Rhizobium bangladeshense]MBY3612545.1 hypothetical protein [Rhizobium bangladeshense]QSY97364.1 hypothetical protein J2J97_24330 [Rhizobium bangladeshense]